MNVKAILLNTAFSICWSIVCWDWCWENHWTPKMNVNTILLNTPFLFLHLQCRVHQRGNKLINWHYWWSLTKKANYYRGKQGKYVWCKKSCACGLKARLSLSLWINFSPPLLRFLYATCLWGFFGDTLLIWNMSSR